MPLGSNSLGIPSRKLTQPQNVKHAHSPVHLTAWSLPLLHCLRDCGADSISDWAASDHDAWQAAMGDGRTDGPPPRSVVRFGERLE